MPSCNYCSYCPFWSYFVKQSVSNINRSGRTRALVMSAASLKEVFDQFAVYGKSAKQKAASKGEMDGRTLVKLAKQAKLTNKKVTQTVCSLSDILTNLIKL